MQVMDFLTVTANTSAVPYEKNECSLYSDNGQCFIYKGRAVVTDGGTYYDVVVYDGIVDFYKEIENKNLSELSLEELTHDKTVPAVINSWNANMPYRYIIADYNGNIGDLQSNTVNIDYLVPSVSIKYLWNKIFEQYNTTYSGSVFSTQNFTNLWMTYPKGDATTGESDHLVFECAQFKTAYYSSSNNNPVKYYLAKYDAGTDTTNELLSAQDRIYLKVADTGTYRLKVKARLFADDTSSPGQIPGTYQPQRSKLFVVKNAEPLGINLAMAQSTTLGDNMAAGGQYEYEITLQLAVNDSVAIAITKATGRQGNYTLRILNLEVSLIRVDPAHIDFGATLSDFSIRDFFTEVLHRFGLTMYKDKYDRYDEESGNYKPHYTFVTLGEQLQAAEIEDWSEKFSTKIKEDYIYGNYARLNWMRYNYNDKENTHNDACIEVDNVNLPDNRDIIKSKIYSPEKNVNSQFFVRSSRVYKLWEKEVKEGQDMPEYKPLDKRYYFLRAEPVTTPVGLTLYASGLSQSQPVASCYLESFYNMSFGAIQQEYYMPTQRILDKSLLVSANMYLNENDICNFDFKKLYFIKQLSNYFIVNKINNYVPGKPVKVDMVRVNYTDVVTEKIKLRITKVTILEYVVKVYFENNTNIIHNSGYLIAADATNGVHYNTWTLNNNPMYADFSPSGTFKIRAKIGDYTSNEVTINIPSNTTIIPPL